jgi:hypothetical protein
VCVCVCVYVCVSVNAKSVRASLCAFNPFPTHLDAHVLFMYTHTHTHGDFCS